MDINELLARQLNKLRLDRKLTIAELANRSGVSRAMVSRIERAESSPTVTVLNNLSVGLGVLVTEMFGPVDYREPRLRLRNPVASRRNQPVWTDSGSGSGSGFGPGFGYRRRTLTPATAGQTFQLFEMLFAPGARVIHEIVGAGAQRQIWLLRGQLEVRSGDEITTLAAGDCMALAQHHAVTLHNAGPKEVRCVVAQQS